MSLKVTDISMRFAGNRVLSCAGFEAIGGQIVGLCGRSGSGKSTFLDIISEQLKPDSGTISLNGNKIDVSDVCYLPTIPENRTRIPFFTKSRGRRSTAELQIQSFNEALSRSAPLVVLDDPLRGVDRILFEKCVDELRNMLSEKRNIVVFASSDFDTVLYACDKVLMLEGGEICQEGSPQEIYETPATCSIADFTGRCNLIEARRVSSSKADIQEFQTILGSHRLFAKRAELASLGALNKNAFLAIRPEQLSISFGASFPEDNLLKASICNIRFLGSSTLVSLDSEGLPLLASVQRLVGLAVGDECMVGLPPDRLQIMSK